jgi:hypothetical protein
VGSRVAAVVPTTPISNTGGGDDDDDDDDYCAYAIRVGSTSTHTHTQAATTTPGKWGAWIIPVIPMVLSRWLKKSRTDTCVCVPNHPINYCSWSVTLGRRGS